MAGISAIILAAGGSTRLGRPKQAVVFQGETLLRRAVKTALAAAVDRPVIVVLGAGAEENRRDIADLPVQTVTNAAWAAGIGSSIRAGITCLREQNSARAVVLMTCDQPMVSFKLINALITAFEVGTRQMAAAHYGGLSGVPALFARGYFEALATLPDGEGAKRVLREHPKDVYAVPFPEGTMDIDTPSDMERLHGS